MKKILLCAGVCALVFSITGCKPEQTSIPEGEKKTEIMFVTAGSGLVLRDKPDPAGKKLMVISQGDQVEVLGWEGNDVTLAGATGKWAHVRYRTLEGYAFGGFLSKEPKKEPKLEDYTMLPASWKEYSEEGAPAVKLPSESRFEKSVSTGTDANQNEMKEIKYLSDDFMVNVTITPESYDAAARRIRSENMASGSTMRDVTVAAGKGLYFSGKAFGDGNTYHALLLPSGSDESVTVFVFMRNSKASTEDAMRILNSISVR